MSKLKRIAYSLLLILGVSGGLWAQTGNRVFLFPTGGSSGVTVLDAATLANVGTVTASPQAFLALGVPDGSKYYIIAGNPFRTVTVVSAATLAVTRTLDLGANASGAAISPDGRRLLVTAGTLRIYDTATDAELANLAMGIGPTDIEITNDSTRAYVLSPNSGLVTVINLTTNAVINQVAFNSPLSMALAPSNAQLLVLVPAGLSIVSTSNLNVLTTISLSLSFGKVLVTPDSGKAIVVNRGSIPFNISQLVDLTANTAVNIGTGGLGFEQVVIADNSTAFGVVTGSNTVGKIDLTNGFTTVQTYGQNTRAIDLAPGGRTLYLASQTNSTVTRVDVSSNTSQTQSLGVAPSGTSAAFVPPTGNANSIIINGGNNQTVVAGQSATIPLSVRLTASDGSPVFNQAVTFSTTTSGVSFTPGLTVNTNSRGIAQVNIAVPTTGFLQALQGAGFEEAAPPGPVEQGIQTISVTATAGGAGNVIFTLTVGSGSGLTIISGNHQIGLPSSAFPLPLVVRVADAAGFPLPAGTEVTFFASNFSVFPTSTVVATGSDGLAKAQLSGGTLTAGFVFQQTTVTASVSVGTVSNTVSFTLVTALNLPDAPTISSGDGQTGQAGTKLASPLVAQVSNPAGPFGDIGVVWSVVSGPAGVFSASFSPQVSVSSGSGLASTTVTLGPKSGPEPIIVRAHIPGVFGGANFTLTATTGPAERVTVVQGDNQEGRPGTALARALRVRVTDLFNNPVPLPSTRFPLTWTVNPSGAATLSNNFQQADGEASILVNVANFSGPFTVTAVSGNGRATFNLRAAAVPAAVVLIGGNNQSVAPGATTAQALIVQVNDAQGNPVGAVPVTFSGPSTVILAPAQGPTGNPLTINTSTDGRASVSVRALAGPLGALTVTATTSVGSISFTVNVAGRTPVFSAASILNSASFRAGMAPGGLATVFGTGLSEITGREFPGGATTHRGVRVSIEGVDVPMYLVSNESGVEQINFQVRFDLGTPSRVRVQVNNNGSITTISDVPVLRAQPGIFEYTPAGSSLRYAAAVKLDGTVVGPNNPADRDSVLILFLTGMGPVLPVLQTGQAGPSSPPAETFFRPLVGLAGMGIDVLFSGYAPTFVGLYQVNVRIPRDAPVGSVVNLDVIVEGEASQTSRIAVR